jgi:hypothetical protein
MARPRFVDILLLASSALFENGGAALVSAKAHDYNCEADSEGSTCAEFIDVDDTGLMQTPLRVDHDGAVKPSAESDTGLSAPPPTAGIELEKNAKDLDFSSAGNQSEKSPPEENQTTGAESSKEDEPLMQGKENIDEARERQEQAVADVVLASGVPKSTPSPVASAPDDRILTSSWTGSKASSHGPVVWVRCISALVILAMIAKSIWSWRATSCRPRDSLSRAMRKKLEKMRVATGPEVRSALTVSVDDSDKESSPGVLMRIQGRVVSRTAGDFTAPLSGRSCVLYSASVSQHRHDGVHQPPVAFHSAARDFAVQLDDCPEMMLDVLGQDVFTFDMDGGRYACELSFENAPDSWRGFVLAHLTPGVEGGSTHQVVGSATSKSLNAVDLAAHGPLDFKECALVIGTRVTCVGEVVRERNGRLCLRPWTPPLETGNHKTIGLEAGLKIRTMPWLAPKPEPWIRKLMISDDTRLLADVPQLLISGKCRSCS